MLDQSPWDFEGEPGVNPPPGFDNPTDQGRVVFTDEDHAVYISSGGARKELRRIDDFPPPVPCL